jgi:aminopeptidase 2
MLRPLVLRQAGKLGDQSVLAEARDRFARYVGGEAAAIHPDLRHAVFATVLGKGGASELEALLGLYRAADSADQKVIVLRSLGAAPDVTTMEAVVAFTMGAEGTESEVRDQDKYIPIAYLASSSAGRNFMFDWFVRNFDTLHSRYYKGSFLFGRIIASACGDLTTEAKKVGPRPR